MLLIYRYRRILVLRLQTALLCSLITWYYTVEEYGKIAITS